MKVIADGQTIELGTTEAQPTIGIIDYSRRETDEFGVTTVVPRGFARRMSVRGMVPTQNVDALQRHLADLRATPAQWVADERFASLSFKGFYKDFQIDLAAESVSFCTLTIEGLAEMSSAPDTGGDPAADGHASTLRLIQPETVTDAMLVASNVPENDYPAWASGTTYPLGARVIAAHRIFESAAAGNVGNDPTAGSTAWINLGPTNLWAMFDEALGSLTENAGSVTVMIDPVEAVNAVALLDVTGSTVRVQAGGYDRTMPVPASPGMVTFLDVPDVTGAITVTINGSGTVSVGTLLLGRLVGLGVTEASPTAAISDYSRKEADDFGEVTVVERAWAKRMAARALLRSDAVDAVANRIASVRARPCLWIGQDGLEALSIYGFFKDFSIEVGENVSTLQLSVEGLSTAGKIAPLVGDVSWSDVRDDDPLHPKPEDGATVGATPEQLDQLNQTGTIASSAAAAAAAAQAQIAAIEASVTLDLSQLNSEVDALDSSLTIAKGNISGLDAQAQGILASVGQIGTDIDQLESSVSTLGGSVNLLSQTVTNLNGTVSTLSSTVSTQGGQISQVAQSVATLSGSLSTLTTIVTASSSPNLIQNGGFENMLRGWSPAGQWGVYTWAWGRYAECTGYVNNSGQDRYFYLTSDAVPCAPGPNPHAQSFDYELSGDDGVLCYGEIVWLRDDNSYITQTGTTAFGRKGFDQSGNSRIRHVHTAPSADTAKLQARVVFKIPAGATATGMRFRQLKVELGNIATPYSGEATAAQSYQAFSDLNSSFASLSTTVSSQGGSITTLQQSFTSLSGTVSSLSQTVSAQGGSISSLQQVQSTQAGTIATLQTQVTAGGGNLLTNTDLAVNTSGWQFGRSADSGSTSGGRETADDPWSPPGENSLRISLDDGTSSGFAEWDQYIPVRADEWYEASSLVAAHRCNAEIYIQFFDAAGNGLNAPSTGQFSTGSGGKTLADWTHRGVKGQAPSNATRARIILRKYGTYAGQANSYAWFCRPQIVVTTAIANSPVPYSPGSARAAINFQAQAISTLNGQQASLTTTVNAHSASISQNSTAISNLQGTQAQLSTTVSTQGAAITNLQTATSTLQGNVATLTTQVTAGSPNLLRNGSFEMGNMNYWSANGGSFNANPNVGTWGSYASSNADVPDGSYIYIDSNSIDVERDWHTLTADVGYFINGGSGFAYLEIIWWNSSSQVIGQNGGASRPASFNFSPDGATRRLLQVTAFPPEGTTRAAARIVWYKTNGVAQSMHVRQVKLERGQVATAYSSEASVTQSFQTLSTLDTQYASLSSAVGVLGASVSQNAQAISNLNGQYAALSSTVSAQGASVTQNAQAISTLNGNVATLFAQWVLDVQVGGIVGGIKLANNGSATSLKFRSDLTEFTGSTSTARAEFRGGTWFGYDDTGRKRYQIGNMALS